MHKIINLFIYNQKEMNVNVTKGELPSSYVYLFFICSMQDKLENSIHINVIQIIIIGMMKIPASFKKILFLSFNRTIIHFDYILQLNVEYYLILNKFCNLFLHDNSEIRTECIVY